MTTFTSSEPTIPALALRAKEAAKAIGIGERLLWEMTNRGEIPHLKVGRCVLYPVRELQDWMAEQAKEGRR